MEYVRTDNIHEECKVYELLAFYQAHLSMIFWILLYKIGNSVSLKNSPWGKIKIDVNWLKIPKLTEWKILLLLCC